ncbi:hypothetical protein ACFXKC_54235 [Streptomyces sp. NPDC059340]|uniref:hypothetical protein n=1 Tax=Streptomyces sp. NPDC059340 TaxID=3346806 RepID=UPI0036B51CB3
MRAIRAGKSWLKSAGAGLRPVRRISRNRNRQVEVERQAVGAASDDLADLLADKRLAVAGEPAGEVVVTVLGGEVAFTDLRDVRIVSDVGWGVAYVSGTSSSAIPMSERRFMLSR